MRKTLNIFMIIFNSCGVFEDENEVTYSLANLANMSVSKVTYQESFLGGLRTFRGRSPGALGEDILEDAFLEGRQVTRETRNASNQVENVNNKNVIR